MDLDKIIEKHIDLDDCSRVSLFIEEIKEVAKEYHKQQLIISGVIVPKGTFYCDCVQPSMQKPISETEYECFDCGKEVKQ